MALRRMSATLIFVLGLAVLAAACGSPDGAGNPSARPTGVADASPGAIESPTNVPASASSAPATESSAPTSIIAEDAACGSRISEDFAMFQSVDELVWSSHQVIVGTVVEILPARKITIEGTALPFTIVTDAIVKIDQQFRGKAADTVRVRTLGGSIGGCAQEYPDSPQLKSGTQVLLFLREPDAPTGDNAYEFTGGFQGYWTISTGGLVDTRAAHLVQSSDPVTLASIEMAISTTLAAGPPADDPLLKQFMVPLSEAPIVYETSGTPTTTP